MAPTDNTVARTLHDLGLAAWFGGSLMGATGVNGAAAVVQDPTQRLRVANTGWARWTPLHLAGIVAHLAGGAVLTGANKGRLAGQQGVATASTVKAVLTVAALGVTGYARVLGKKLERAGDVPVEGGTTPNPTTPEEAARAQRQLTALQWVIPALTGAVLVVNARMGEQQRPTQVSKGLVRRLLQVARWPPAELGVASWWSRGSGRRPGTGHLPRPGWLGRPHGRSRSASAGRTADGLSRGAGEEEGDGAGEAVVRGHGGSAAGRQAIEAPVEAASSDLGARLAVDRQGAIGEIYAALGTTVLSYLQRLVGRDDAEDVLQRVFYEVWRHNGRYDPSRSLTGWVLGIARNRAIDHLRRQRNTAVALETLDDIPGEDGRELAERYARSHEVRSALIRLPEEQREVLVLAYFGGYTQSQIATYLDLPLGTVKARTFRGLRRLAKLLIQ